MSREEGNQEKNVESQQGASGERTVDECADIKDPVRKGLCRICQAPVIGEAPFCKDHEPPVP
ncbi:MAG TPA: hypothetical protein VMC85_17470 [Desulfomonilaceae bacterium]|nr:hypothetical protein [Desulfomonilaceae bacterium]